MSRSNRLRPSIVLSAGVLAASTLGAWAVAPQPVSPGSAGEIAVVEASCPTFSWGEVPRARAYELAVYPLSVTAEPDDAFECSRRERSERRERGAAAASPAPVLEERILAAATSWTPPLGRCLVPGQGYVWRVREIGEISGFAGTWSVSVPFVIGSSAGAPGPTEAERSGGFAELEKPLDPGAPEWGNAVASNALLLQLLQLSLTNQKNMQDDLDAMQDDVDSMQGKLDELLEPEIVKLEICGEIAVAGEIGFAGEGALKTEVEGRAGAEGFGNGIMAKLRAIPGAKIEGAVKGEAAGKFEVCIDLRELVAAVSAAEEDTEEGSKAKVQEDFAGDIVGMQDELRDKLLAFVDSLEIDGSKLVGALDAIPNMSDDVDPAAMLRGEGNIAQLAQALPLPGPLGDRLRNPSGLFEKFEELKDVCSNQGLPPALEATLGPICDLSANEPYSKLLKRVDGTVGSVFDKIESIIDRLPTASDCKFFCGD